jgi:hypothetical protein
MFVLSPHWGSETDQASVLIPHLPSSLTLVSPIVGIYGIALLEGSFHDE